MKHLTTLVLCTLSLFACARDNKQVITLEQLPQAAQQTIATYATDEPVVIIIQENDLFDTDYEVRFHNGNEWKFDEQGQIESLDNAMQPLPATMLPEPLVAYVNQHFAGQSIREYSVDRRDYEITLMSGIELKFDKSFRLLETDID